MAGKKKVKTTSKSKSKATAQSKSYAKSTVVVKIDQRKITKGRSTAPAVKHTTTFIGSSAQPQFIPQYPQPQPQPQITSAQEVSRNVYAGVPRRIEEEPRNWDTNSDYFSLDMLSAPSSQYSFSTNQNEFGSVASTIPPPEVRIGNKIIVNRQTGKVIPKPPSITESIQITPSTPAPPSISSTERTPPDAFTFSETSSTRNRRIEALNEEA